MGIGTFFISAFGEQLRFLLFFCYFWVKLKKTVERRNPDIWINSGKCQNLDALEFNFQAKIGV